MLEILEPIWDYSIKSPFKNVFGPSYRSIKDKHGADIKATLAEGSAFARPILSFFEQRARTRSGFGDKISHKAIRAEHKKLIAALGEERARQEIKRRLGLNSGANNSTKAFDFKSGIQRVFNNHKDRFLSDTQDAVTKAIILSSSLTAGGAGGYLVAKKINNAYINPVITGMATGMGSMWLANKLYNKYKNT
jgi:hypothetical protein